MESVHTDKKYMTDFVVVSAVMLILRVAVASVSRYRNCESCYSKTCHYLSHETIHFLTSPMCCYRASVIPARYCADSMLRQYDLPLSFNQTFANENHIGYGAALRPSEHRNRAAKSVPPLCCSLENAVPIMKMLHPVRIRHWRRRDLIEAHELFSAQQKVLRIEICRELLGRASSDDDRSNLRARE